MIARTGERTLAWLLRALLPLTPLLLALAAYWLAEAAWREVVLAQPEGSRARHLAWRAWPTVMMLGPVAVLLATLGLRALGLAGLAGVLAAAAGTLWAVIELGSLLAGRLAPAWDQGGPARLGQAIDLNLVVACFVGLMALVSALRTVPAGLSRAGARGGGRRTGSDAHGHADWMDIREARRRFDPTTLPLGGLCLGEAYRVDRTGAAGTEFDPRDPASWGEGGRHPLLVLDLAKRSGHGIATQASGQGKTSGLIVPSCLTYAGPLVVLDGSGEVFPMVREARQRLGRSVVAIDPLRPGSGFDLLAGIDRASPTLEADIRARVDWICGERPPERPGGPSGGARFFENRGRVMVEAVLSDLLAAPGLEPPTVTALAARLGCDGGALRAQLQRIARHSPSRRARYLAAQLCDLVEETFSGIFANLGETTEWLGTPAYADLLSRGAFQPGDLAAGRVDVFINLPFKVIEAAPGLARCVVGALLAALMDAARPPPAKVLFLLDEVYRLGPMTSLERARDLGRKYGIALALFYQSSGQLEQQWGRAGKAAWTEAAGWRCFAGIRDLAQARELSELCGEHGVLADARSESEGTTGRGGLEWPSRSHGRSASVAERGRRLIRPEEIVADLRGDEQIVLIPGHRPLRCGVSYWFRRRDMRALVRESRFEGAAP